MGHPSLGMSWFYCDYAPSYHITVATAYLDMGYCVLGGSSFLLSMVVQQLVEFWCSRLNAHVLLHRLELEAHYFITLLLCRLPDGGFSNKIISFLLLVVLFCKWNIAISPVVTHLKNIYIYLAASGLRCSMWNLCCSTWAPGVSVCGDLRNGSSFPDQKGVEPTSHALQDGFITTGPWGKSYIYLCQCEFKSYCLCNSFLSLCWCPYCPRFDQGDLYCPF